jgi:hypothetical protein
VIRAPVEIHCDSCTDWIHGYTDIPKKALEEAKRQGWIRRRDPDTKKMQDVCPKCQKGRSKAKDGPHHQDEPR